MFVTRCISVMKSKYAKPVTRSVAFYSDKLHVREGYKLAIPSQGSDSAAPPTVFVLSPEKPISSLLTELKANDSSVETAEALTAEGLPLASSTQMGDLMREDFKLKLNNKEYLVLSPDAVDLSGHTRPLIENNKVMLVRGALAADHRHQIPYTEYIQLCKQVAGFNEAQARELSQHLHRAGVALHFSDDPTLQHMLVINPESVAKSLYSTIDARLPLQESNKALLTRLAIVREELTVLRERKNELDLHTHRVLQRWVWGGFGYLTLQASVLARWTWIDYGWDVVEPMGYFLGFVAVLGGYAFWARTGTEYSFSEAYTHMIEARRRKAYSEAQFNFDHYKRLEKEENDIKDTVSQNCRLVYGLVPEEVSAVLNPKA